MTIVAGFGVGAALAPALLAGVGIRTSLVILGLVVPLLVLAFGPPLIRMDAAATAPDADRLALLGRTPIFAPLPGSTLERLAGQLIPVASRQARCVIREGDAGDRFYLVSRVGSRYHGLAHVATLGPGDPSARSRCSATCLGLPLSRAAPTELFALTREDFLTASEATPRAGRPPKPR